jgi:galactokinase
MVALVEADQIEVFGSATKQAYQDLTGIEPAIYATVAAPGAAVVTDAL